jgi:outer membrane cobalamin receptor
MIFGNQNSRSLAIGLSALVLAITAHAVFIGSPCFAQAESAASVQESAGEPDIGSGSTTEGEDVIDLGSIYVGETLFSSEEILDRPTAFSTVIDAEALAEQSLTLPEVLESVPGISIRSMGGLGSLSTVSIRGLGSENVLVLLDGVPLNPTGGSVDLSDIPLASLERIEISRGGESAYFGAGAVGGVIRLISAGPGEEHTTGSMRCSIGSFDTATSAFTWRPPNSMLHIEASGSRGDFRFLNNKGTGLDPGDDFIDNRENNEYGSMSARMMHRWELGDSRLLSASGEWFRADKGIPGIVTFPSPNASQADTRTFFDALYENRNCRDGQLTASLSWLRQSRSFSDPLGESTGVPLFTSWVHNRIDSKIEWAGPGFGESDLLTSGFYISNERLDSTDSTAPDRTDIAVAVRDEWYAWDNGALTGAIRADWLDGDLWLSTRGGLKYPLSDGWSVRTNLGLDFRPPSFEELYRSEGLVVGNPDLVPERTLSYDIGLTRTTERLRMEAAYFNLQTRDLIDYLLIAGYRWKPYNIGRARSSGFELAIDYLLANDLELRGNFTRTNAIDTSGDPTRLGKRLVGQPSTDLYAELRWSPSPWEVFATWERRGPSPITPTNSRMLPSYEIAGIGIGRDFRRSGSLMLEIRNMLDSSVTDVRGFPLPGRSFFVTWKEEW